MNKYTVVLMYPDYMSDSFGQESYMAWVKADSLKDAALKAQRIAAEESMPYKNKKEIEEIMKDFFIVFMCDGHVDDLSFVARTKLYD